MLENVKKYTNKYNSKQINNQLVLFIIIEKYLLPNNFPLITVKA
jgi:hypothetical protein